MKENLVVMSHASEIARANYISVQIAQYILAQVGFANWLCSKRAIAGWKASRMKWTIGTIIYPFGDTDLLATGGRTPTHQRERKPAAKSNNCLIG
jgi:hypothetical protein